ncbi:hypothetical protein DY000_02024202 [Brassica cretica]|uniref:Uncharacterized protein n=1 Tax=Brassica cretica TaxID=69181 RepID=A0ABQ7E0X7_BRACR|nr:hypothetical protein DY000_02024202 [Brassica cretica]
MHGLMSYRRFGRARSLRSDRALARAWSLCSDRAEHAFGCCVATLFELLSDDSRFFRKAFRKEESISKKYLSKKVFTFFFFGDSDVNFVVTVFDPNIRSDRALYVLGRYVATNFCVGCYAATLFESFSDFS